MKHFIPFYGITVLNIFKCQQSTQDAPDVQLPGASWTILILMFLYFLLKDILNSMHLLWDKTVTFSMRLTQKLLIFLPLLANKAYPYSTQRCRDLLCTFHYQWRLLLQSFRSSFTHSFIYELHNMFRSSLFLISTTLFSLRKLTQA